ncbi:MAG: hypothetical protein WBM86_21100 [Waterburya sp.]
MPKFKDPKTGQIVNVNSFLVFLSSLCFGMFFFLYIGETQHALVMVGFAILITLVGIFVSPIAILYAYIFPLIYSFIAPKIVKDKWLNKGYKQVLAIQKSVSTQEKVKFRLIAQKEQEIIKKIVVKFVLPVYAISFIGSFISDFFLVLMLPNIILSFFLLTWFLVNIYILN